MATTTEKAHVVARIDNIIEPAPLLRARAQRTNGRQRFFDIRRRFGIHVFPAPTGIPGAEPRRRDPRSTTETLLGEARTGGALHRPSNGTATFERSTATSVEAPAGSFVLVQPTAKRKATAKDDGTTILAIGGTPGKAYEPPPEEAADAFPRVQRGRLRDRCGQAARRGGEATERRRGVLQRRLLRGPGRSSRRGDRASATGRRAERPRQGAHPLRRGSGLRPRETRASTC